MSSSFCNIWQAIVSPNSETLERDLLGFDCA